MALCQPHFVDGNSLRHGRITRIAGMDMVTAVVTPLETVRMRRIPERLVEIDHAIERTA